MAVLALVVMVMEAVTVGVIDRPPSRWVSRGSLVWSLDPTDIADESALGWLTVFVVVRLPTIRIGRI